MKTMHIFLLITLFAHSCVIKSGIKSYLSFWPVLWNFMNTGNLAEEPQIPQLQLGE